MRYFIYGVVNKETGKAVFMNFSESKCQEYLETLENKENYFIGHRWYSV